MFETILGVSRKIVAMLLLLMGTSPKLKKEEAKIPSKISSKGYLYIGTTSKSLFWNIINIKLLQFNTTTCISYHILVIYTHRVVFFVSILLLILTPIEWDSFSVWHTFEHNKGIHVISVRLGSDLFRPPILPPTDKAT